jgi:molecular chaperone Hsp33
VLVGVLEGPEGVRAAGGMLVEVLPGGQLAAIEKLEANLAVDSSVSRAIDRGGLAGLRDRVLDGLAPELLDRRELRFHCGCDRDRLRRQLATLSEEDRGGITDGEGTIVAECAWCGERYRYSAGELAEV